jgi:ADP-ribosyl-[dinitrogen reductase] hydrolase
MTLAIAEALVARDPWTPRALADRFVQAYRRDPRPGYARGFASVLKQCKDGADFLRLIRPTSERNGAAMRSLPLGVLPSMPEVKEFARIQARLTHDTPGGIASSQAIGLVAHFGLKRSGSIENLVEFLRQEAPSIDWKTPWRGPVPITGIETVRAVVTQLRAHRSLTQLLRGCVGLTGDTDTAACLALGAAVCYPEYRRDLAPALVNRLEDGRYGRRYLLQLNRRLL